MAGLFICDYYVEGVFPDFTQKLVLREVLPNAVDDLMFTRLGYGGCILFSGMQMACQDL